MPFERSYIPHRGYWSTPFCRWQGSFAHLNSLTWVAEVANEALSRRRLDVDRFDALYLGTSVPQHHSFYGAPWVASLLGAPHLTGPTISQACATSARVIGEAAMSLECGMNDSILCLTADRTSNGPHIYYPNPLGPGGRGATEDWVWDNFNCDPAIGIAMVETAENVARAHGITREQQDEVALERYEQYETALADERAFQRRYMLDLRVAAPSSRGSEEVVGDQGVRRSTAEGLAALGPIREGGLITYGAQTHPADANCGFILTSREKAREVADDPGIEIKVLSYGQARVKPGFMGEAPVPAAADALRGASLEFSDIIAVKTHNPFVVNDIYFSQQMGIPTADMNRFGSSLIYGHPQGPTGMRLLMELIEELVLRGGGFGLFSGCAAGDTGAALVVSVSDAGPG
ncbi:MAG: thiolase family protein [Actinomycetota bacterium]|nr:thiolase family protein [Actinomycetota bacterium]